MKFIKTTIEETYFEETRSGFIFHPNGNSRAGKTKAYVIPTDGDKSNLFSFLKKQMVWSYLFILSLPLIGFGTFFFLKFILPEMESSTSGIVSYGVVFFSPCVFRLWYDRRVKKMTTGWSCLIAYMTYDEAIRNLFSKTNRITWVLASIAIVLLISECMILSTFI